MRKVIFAIRYLKHKLFSGFHHLGWRVIFDQNFKLSNPQCISIGSHVTIDNDCEIAVIKDYEKHSSLDDRPIIKIESAVGISKFTTIFAVKSISIGKNTMIGPYCFMADYDHSYNEIDKPIASQPLTNIKPIVIEKGAWLGAHVTICSGVTIGKNSVVGAGSVVSKSIPPFCLAVGVPAKVIKQYNFQSKKWEKVK